MLLSSGQEACETGLAVYMSTGGNEDWDCGEMLAQDTEKAGVEVGEESGRERVGHY